MSLYVAGVSLAVFLTISFIYGSFSYDTYSEIGQSIDSELSVIEDTYQTLGMMGLTNHLAMMSENSEVSRLYYLVVDKNNKKILGNLKWSKKFQDYDDGWLSFEIDLLRGDGQLIEERFVVRSINLDNGYKVLAARRYDDIMRSSKLVSDVLLSSMLATMVLGILTGTFVAWFSTRRVDTINQSIIRIVEGDLSERIAEDRQEGDYQVLTKNFNHLLDRLQASIQNISHVTDNIAHDLRTPLTRLRNGLVSLEENSNDAIKPEVNSLLNEADGLLKTFSALLRIAKIEAGQRKSGFTVINIQEILFDVYEMYEPLAQDKEITMGFSGQPCKSVIGDRNLWFQALANVVDNAIKYTPENGAVDIRLIPESDKIKIIIADSGIGIPESDRVKVFERFYRVEESRGLEPGNGLGLSLVAAVTHMHKSKIVLGDNKPGLIVEILIPKF